MIDGETSALSSDENLLLKRHDICRVTFLIGNDGIQINELVFLIGIDNLAAAEIIV